MSPLSLTLIRAWPSSKATCGEIFIDGDEECYTIELPIVDGKPGSAIPQGTFGIILAPSYKFKSNPDPWIQRYANAMPHLADIPGRSLIMIHWANTVEDVDGCIGVGKDRLQANGKDFLTESRATFARLYEKIQYAASERDCTITIVDGMPTDPEMGQ